MKTRERILIASLKLFNSKGIGKTSVRNICEAVHISLGNFTYYFPNKETVIVELCNSLFAELGKASNQLQVDKKSILFFLEYHRQIFGTQNDYKFFYLNTFELVKNFDKIHVAYLQYIENAQTSMKELFQLYRLNGVFKNELEEGFANKLISVGQMVDSFWIIDAEINFKGNGKRAILHYLTLCCSLIQPFLSEAALKEYSEFFKELH